jgi:hypothetical protein
MVLSPVIVQFVPQTSMPNRLKKMASTLFRSPYLVLMQFAQLGGDRGPIVVLRASIQTASLPLILLTCVWPSRSDKLLLTEHDVGQALLPVSYQNREP